MSILDNLSCADCAAFAVTSRLLSCIVAESFLKAIFVATNSSETVGTCIILSKNASEASGTLEKLRNREDIFAIVPLRAPPVLEPFSASKLGQEIALVDPLDMLPFIYEVSANPNLDIATKLDLSTSILSNLPPPYHDLKHTRLSSSLDPLSLWKRFSRQMNLDPQKESTIALELRSSLLWQEHAYENRPVRPTLASSSTEWEQALIEGHPTHPMHRARRTLPPMRNILPGQYDFYNPRVRFVSIPRESLKVQGDFETLLAPLRQEASRNAGKPLTAPENRILLPVHELQLPNISSKFSDAVILPEEFSVATPAQASIRTVTLPFSPEITLKLAVGMKISSALRTISHFTAYSGPRFSTIVPKLAIDRKVLVVENEVASAVYKHENPEIAKHCTAVIREAYGGVSEQERGERVIVAAALVETAYGDKEGEQPAVVTALGLDTAEKKFAFLERYVNLIFDAALPPLIVNGVAFEAHGQNTLARFDIATGQLTGFVFRDFGGLGIHKPTLLASTGQELDTLPEHCIVVDDIQEAYRRIYHTLIHSHLHRLIRVLGFHHNGRGWALVKKSLQKRIPRGSELWKAWLDPDVTTVMGKSLLRMKLEGVYRDYLYGGVPNLIHYRSQVA